MTTTENRPIGSVSAESEAVARWAAAAGVPESVARGYESRTPAAVRFLRGVLLGAVLGVPVLLFASSDGPADGLDLVLVLGLVLVVLQVVRRRRRR